jgi:plastocyanin
MALNFPNNPTVGDTYTSGGVTWEFNGTAWNIVYSSPERNLFVEFAGDTGTAVPSDLNDSLVIAGGANITTSVSGKTVTIDSSGTTQNLFQTVVSDDGSTTASTATDTVNILGGENIATRIDTDTSDVTIDLATFEIGFLSNVSSAVPSTGEVLKWDGAQWAPGTDIAEGGAGLDADTLDGFDSSYYLDYSNFTNTPSVVTLSDLSIGNELTPSGNGAVSYDNSTGVFRYTPPDLSGFLTSVAFADLTSTPSTLAGYGITDAASDLTDLGITDGSSGQVLTTDGAGNFSFETVTSGGSGATNFIELSDTPSSFGTAGQVVAVNSTGDGLIFTDDQTGTGGEDNQNAFSSVAVSGETTVTADTTTDTLTLQAGSNIALTTSNNTVTIASTADSGATDFDALSDVATASLDVSKIYEPAIAMLRVDNNGASAYTFNSHYSGDNPTIYALAGTTIAFDLDGIPGHPFEIQDPFGDPYNVGLTHVAADGTVSTGSSAQGKQSGTLYWRIQETVSGGYRYQCQVHAGMVGGITIKRLSTI